MANGKKLAAGVRRTYDIGVAEAWALMVSAEGNELLTGRRTALSPEGTLSSWGGPPIAYRLTTYAPGSHFRMRWRESGLPSARSGCLALDRDPQDTRIRARGGLAAIPREAFQGE